MSRKLVPAVAAVVMAFLIELGAQEVGWGSGLTYGLIGFAAASLILVGGPFAMGLRLSRRPTDLLIDKRES
jgi:predicted cobalt transporter CbtA